MKLTIEVNLSDYEDEHDLDFAEVNIRVPKRIYNADQGYEDEHGKTCTKCGTYKPYEEFHRSMETKRIYKAHCGKCSVTHFARPWRKANPGRWKEVVDRRARNLDERDLGIKNCPKIRAMRDEIRRRNKEAGYAKWSLDHIVPLNGDGYKGFHTHWNCDIMELKENSIKSNKWQ